MREIKFRVWDNENKEFFTPVFMAYQGKLKEMLLTQAGELMLREIIGTTHCPSVYPDRFEYQQYTGLKDKNGKEIYESDIVRCEGKQRTVKWANGKFWFLVESSNQHEDISEMFGKYYNKVEVIGNCYETPDLL